VDRDIATLMLTAHALAVESLKKSAEDGADYYVPKDEMKKIALFIADVIEARQMGKNAWVRWFERFSTFCDTRYGGTGWREMEKKFWEEKLEITLP